MPAPRIRRAAEVCSYYPLSLDIPDLTQQIRHFPDYLPPPSHVPRPSTDAVLTSLAQLASLRLHAQRALISLIDDQSQIILAEATTTTPLQHSPSDDLWLGSAIIPRACGVCECALEPAAFVVNDLQHDDHFATRSFVRAPPALRFYAGVPLKSFSGCTIGVLCIFDDAPRQGLDPAQLLLMQDLAAVIVSYLATSRGHEANRKAEQMVRGLTSFVTGAADLQQASELDVPCASDNDLHSRTSQKEEETIREEECLVSQDQLFPPLVTRMFARAANIMRESCQLDGVIFFDLSAVNEASSNEIPSISPTPESHSAGPFISSTSDDEFSDDDHSPSFSQECRPTCKIIGFADASRSTLHGNSPRRGYLRLTEKSLKGLLKSHSQGIVFDVSETNADNGSVEFAQEGEVRGRTTVNAIVDVANDACSAAIIPLWDYERERWLAGCLCWVSDPNRALTYGSDLLYYRAFGHSILAEMSRINSIAVEQAKAKFIESMSHELRSPLHGILGGVEYLQSMKLDVFQTDIVNSIATCGRTLLDTISNVLEYSKINDFTGPYAQPNRAALRHTSAVRNDMDPAVDIRHLTEETIEAVSAGQSYDINTAQFCSGENGLFNSPPTPGAEGPIRKNVRLILDLSNRSYWTFAVQPGIWRRIVMNVFGNALRFTDVGFVKVSLSAKDISDGSSEIVLTVADSGVGMSADFVQHDLFKPFSQKSSFTSGTGLGMNIVQRLVHSLGGELSVQSEVNVGTVIKISLRLHKCNKLKDDFESSIATQANGRQVVIVRELIPESAETFELSRQSEQDFHSSLADTLQAWFGIDVTTSHKVSSENAQLIIYPGPTFEEGFIKRSRKGISVVIALDGIEAATLRADPRVRSGRVEVFTQPCGPSKLAKILGRYFAAESEPPRQPDVAATQLPGTQFTSELPLRPESTVGPNQEETRKQSIAASDFTSQSIPANRHDDTGTPNASSTHTLTRSHTPPSPSEKHTTEQPLSQENLPPLPPPSPPPAPAPQAPPGKDVLIVDDNPLNLRLLSAFLKKHSFQHASAMNGLEALELFKENSSRWAAVLMDLSMPVMDGVTATREIRAWERRLPEESGGGGDGRGRGGELRDAGDVVPVEEGQGSTKTSVDVPAKEDVIHACTADAVQSTGIQLEEAKEAGAPTEEQSLTPAPATRSSTDPSPLDSTTPHPIAYPGVQIIVLTGLGSATARCEAMSAGADIFMTKPIRFGELMKTLKETIDR